MRLWTWRPLGRPGSCSFCVYIRFFGCGRWRFRSYSESLWQTPQSNQRSGPRRTARSLGLGVPSFRDSSGGIAYGLLRCTSSRCMRLRRTVAALPPPDKSLHSAFRRGRYVKSGTRANAHCVEWWEAKAKAKAKSGVGLYMFLKTRVHFGISRRCSSLKHLGRSPLPLGEG